MQIPLIDFSIHSSTAHLLSSATVRTTGAGAATAPDVGGGGGGAAAAAAPAFFFVAVDLFLFFDSCSPIHAAPPFPISIIGRSPAFSPIRTNKDRPHSFASAIAFMCLTFSS